MLGVESLMEVTKKIEEADLVSPSVERWLAGTKELELELSKRFVQLSRYISQIPNSILPDYSHALVKILNNSDIKSSLTISESLAESMRNLATVLDKVGEEQTASDVREAINGIIKNHD
jgi:hypothetical protein